MIFPLSYLRFRKQPPNPLRPPPSGQIDMYYSPEAGKFIARDALGNVVKFDADGGSDIETSTGGNGEADAGKAPLYGALGELLALAVLAEDPDTDHQGVTVFHQGLDYQQSEASGLHFFLNFPTLTLGTGSCAADLPPVTGYVPLVPGYVDLTAANTALAAGDYWWDTTLNKLRIATA